MYPPLPTENERIGINKISPTARILTLLVFEFNTIRNQNFIYKLLQIITLSLK